MSKTVCIVQARMGSTRLPNKAMLDLCGRSMLERVVDRVMLAYTAFDLLVVATGTTQDNDVIEDVCVFNRWECYRGDVSDVLNRYFAAARLYEADHIIRICADDPFIDPSIIKRAAHNYHSSDAEYVSTETIQKSFPIGMHVEVFSADVLYRAWDEAFIWEDREHVTPYIWKNPDKFILAPLVNYMDLSHIRLTVDTMEDYMMARRLYEKFGNAGFHWEDVVWEIERSKDGLLP